MINLKNNYSNSENQIAIMGNNDLGDIFVSPSVIYFQQNMDINAEDFRCIINACEQRKIKIRVTGWNWEGIIHIVENDKELALQEMVSILLDELMVNLDWWDLMQTWKLGTQFVSYTASLPELKANISKWAVDEIGNQSESLIVFLSGDISLADLNDIVNLITEILFIPKVNRTMNVALKYVKNERNPRISVWYH